MRLSFLLIFLIVKPAVGWGAPHSLHPQGTIETFREEHAFTDLCFKVRTYPRIEGLANPRAEAKLNARFAQIMSVGTKLDSRDCPPRSSKQYYRYSQSFELGAQRGNYLGIRFGNYFPYRGRMIFDCRIFDLSTGEEVFLSTRLKKGGLEILQARLREAGPDMFFDRQFDPVGLTPKTKKKPYSPLCLEAGGLIVLKNPFDKRFKHAALSADDIARAFKDDALTRALRK